MLRRLFNGLWVLSLLLRVAAVAVRARSYGRCDWVIWERTGHTYWVATAEGQLMFGREFSYASAGDSTGVSHQTLPTPVYLDQIGAVHVRPRFDQGGFALLADDAPPNGRGLDTFKAAVPIWAFALLSFLPPAVWFLSRRRRWRRRDPGLCPACDYDLRATPGHCPECGRARAGATA